MRKYDESTILLLQCLARIKDKLSDGQCLEPFLKKFNQNHWWEFYFFSPGYLNIQWKEENSEKLAQTVNELITNNLGLLEEEFNQSPNPSIIPQSSKPEQNKSIWNPFFLKEDAGLILFILKSTPSNHQDSILLGFNIFEQLYSNILIPLYHNKNFQMVFTMYMLISIFLMLPFAPHILTGMFSFILTSAIVMIVLYFIFKGLEYCSKPLCRIVLEDNTEYASSQSPN